MKETEPFSVLYQNAVKSTGTRVKIFTLIEKCLDQGDSLHDQLLKRPLQIDTRPEIQTHLSLDYYDLDGPIEK